MPCKKCCFCAERSLFCPHTRPGFPPHPGIFASHPETSPQASCTSLFGQCSFIWTCPLVLVWTHVPPSSGWLACAYGLLLVVVASRHPTAPCLLQMAMTKDAFGGSRVIHGQNCPISDEISQKLDLYSDRPKRGRVYAGRASQSSTHGGRPRFFPAAQILHEVRSVNVFAHTHSRADTPS